MTGFEQVTANPGGRWKASLTFQIFGEEDILTYRALKGALMGRANEVLVAPRDGIRPLNSGGSMFDWRNTLPFSGNFLFFNTMGFAVPSVGGATVAAAAALGAMALTIQPVLGPGPRPGQYFCLVDRLYLVLTTLQSTVGGPVAMTFWPTLRAAAAIGDTVTLDQPVCRMRLAKDESGALELAWRQIVSCTMEFVEAK